MTPTWRDDAACATDDPEMFFPHPTDRDDRERDAKRVCHGCGVSDECLSEAMSDLNLQGVWGGTSQAERARHYRRIHRKR